MRCEESGILGRHKRCVGIWSCCALNGANGYEGTAFISRYSRIQRTGGLGGKLPEDGVFIGRTYRDTPSVDGFIFVNSDTELVSGQYVDVLVTGYDEYDLIGDAKL